MCTGLESTDTDYCLVNRLYLTNYNKVPIKNPIDPITRVARTTPIVASKTIWKKIIVPPFPQRSKLLFSFLLNIKDTIHIIRSRINVPISVFMFLIYCYKYASFYISFNFCSWYKFIYFIFWSDNFIIIFSSSYDISMRSMIKICSCSLSVSSVF